MANDSFNTEQKQAIEHFEGPAMVLAGPGSGKTTVITNRVLNLIEEQGVSPKQILVVTFSNAAAVEMQQGFRSMAEKAYPVRFYPLPEESRRKLVQSMNYMRHYSISSLIAIFFGLSIFGWLWEVGIGLVT